MSKLKYLLAIALVFALISLVNCNLKKWPAKKWPTLNKLKRMGSVEAADQAQTVLGMIERLFPGRSDEFVVTVDPSLIENGHDVFIIDNNNDGQKINLAGSNGVAAAMGFHYYVKYYGNCLFSWSGNQVSSLPAQLPRVASQIKVVTNDLFRYYQNVCTVSYSSVWWTWSRWEQEIDWMALNGINLPLAFTGQEEIFRRVYLNLGYSQEDLDQFFSGPAFLAWNRMGNVDGWGGPLPDDFYRGQLTLQHQIIDRMKSFGMVPVLPAFSGHVPAATANYYPNANLTRLADWGGFNSTYCCTYLLDPSDQLFQTIGQNFISELMNEFGTSHVYNCDTFNEMNPPTDDPNYVAAVGEAVFRAMESADPDAIWLMQGWLFQNSYWTPTLVEALVTSVPIGKMIVLDLFSEDKPLYQNFESYYGQPWIWCMLHNFGGTKGLYGKFDDVNSGPFKGRAFTNSSMIGTGLTMEGIEQNDIMYELTNEMAYLRSPVNKENWLKNWSLRRYGGSDSNAENAWITLGNSALNVQLINAFHGIYVLTNRPRFLMETGIFYNATNFLPSWDLIVAATNSSTVSQSDLFLHDLVDISREGLVIALTTLYFNMTKAYNQNDTEAFNAISSSFLEIIDDLELLLATDRRFLLGPWIESAKALTNISIESSLYEYNARNQITLWGPSGNILDYATKQWSGIVRDYYKPRWTLFVAQVSSAMQSGTTFSDTQYQEDVFNQIESPFTFDTTVYPVEPNGNPIAVAQLVYSKWRNAASGIEDFDYINIETQKQHKTSFY
ncbi:hypothetical protein CHUAL_008565 [Chamberlinius hualienensis]